MLWKMITNRKNKLLLIIIIVMFFVVMWHTTFDLGERRLSPHLLLKPRYPHHRYKSERRPISRNTESHYNHVKHHLLTVQDSAPVHQPLCIEKNICKEKKSDRYYRHTRLPDFIRRIDSSINYDINISHKNYVVPNIVHFVQFSRTTQNQFEFHNMMSVLSAYKHQKPDRIYFWLDREPESKYWIRLRKMVPMYLIIRDRPTSIRGQKVSSAIKVSDVIRMEVLIEYGGMYFDLDVIVVKSFNPLRRYDYTMGKESRQKFCSAVLVSKPWSDFLRLWHKEHVTFDESVWSYHAGLVSYRLSLENPKLIRVEEYSFFRPSYFELEYLYNEGKLFNWRESHYCVHLWIRMTGLSRRITDSNIDSWNTTVGELFRYILYDDWRLRNDESN